MEQVDDEKGLRFFKHLCQEMHARLAVVLNTG
jgi:hypothetical protein